MADFNITPDQVASVTNPIKVRTALVAIEKGDAVYYDNERAGLADANAQNTAAAKGVAVSKCAAGDKVSIAESGAVLNLGTVTGLNAGDPMFVSNTAGKMSPFADLIAGQWPTLVG